ncbi:MAG: ECF-type sigma factor [Gammaproteobacteria bacterium]
MNDGANITQLLNNWSDGDQAAGEALTPLVYDELLKLARRLFRGEGSSHTLQPTALVHEAYAKLIDVDVSWKDRAHFYALAARMMRRLLINHAKSRHAAKRGGNVVRIPLDDSQHGKNDSDLDLLDLDRAIAGLAEVDPAKAELVELQYFGGLSRKEIQVVTGISPSGLDRSLRVARAWLKDALADRSR